jgi:hypothetical protein
MSNKVYSLSQRRDELKESLNKSLRRVSVRMSLARRFNAGIRFLLALVA